MYAANVQNGTDARPSRTGDVGAQTVADGKDAREVVDTEKAEASFIDRAERLAMPAYAPPAFLVPLRQCAGAEGETATTHDDEIRIGAHHRKTTLQRAPQ